MSFPCHLLNIVVTHMALAGSIIWVSDRSFQSLHNPNMVVWKTSPIQFHEQTALASCPSSKETDRTYRMVRALDMVYGCVTVQAASVRLKELILWMHCSRLKPMKRGDLTLRKYQAEILEYFTARIPNALAEGIKSLVQAAKRKAREYPTSIAFSCMIYLVAG